MTAIRRMKQFTEHELEFSFEFFTKQGEKKVIRRAALNKGYRNDQSKRAKFLIAYKDLDTNENRQFHRSLLMKFQDVNVYL
ncbi:MAG: hypothetical protein KBT36_08760 [Kurthia sp.]|nr:hypothetical protein [Candidatus Kurthia equi]